MTTYPITHENDQKMIIGAITIGYRMDHKFAKMVKKMSGADLIFLENGKPFSSSFEDVMQKIPIGSPGFFRDGKIYDLTHIRIKTENITNLGIAVAVDNSSIKHILNITIIIIISLITVFTVISFFFTKKITRHLIKSTDNILEGTRKIESGIYDVEIQLNGNDEFGELADTFNDMAASILNSFKEIESSKSEVQILQHYLSNIINSMPSALIAVDKTLHITQLNKHAKSIIKPGTGDPVGKPLREVLPERSAALENIQQSITAAEQRIFSGMELTTDKGTRYEDIAIYPLIAEEGAGAVIRIDDITERVIMEEQLNHSRKMDSVGQLAGGIAHDFNNMLTGILSAAQLLKLPARNLDETGQKFADIILQSVDRASQLIRKLLAFSRRSKTVSTALDLDKVIDDTTEILKSTIDKKITIAVTKEAQNHNVVGDSTALQNALLNLGINASHAMPDGGNLSINTINITFNKSYCDASSYELEPGEYIEIEIRDTGSGISPEIIKKIFDPFFTTKENGKGTGLGLAAVYGTIREHHGAIEVYSEVGTGTVFRLYLPCTMDETEETDSQKTAIQGSGTILLVDDEELIRITGKAMLEEMGYTVLVAEDGLEALDIFKNKFREIDLVITDMIMPVMNGKEALREMKKIDGECKVILSSGFARNEDIIPEDQNGFSAFIQKPFRDYEISIIIAEILKQR